MRRRISASHRIEDILRSTADCIQWSRVQALWGLSEREVEIVRRVLLDHSESRIASEIGISRHTVHTHLERVFRGVGVHSRVQLAVLIISSGHLLLRETL